VQNFAQQIEVSRRAVTEMQEFKDLILREQGQVTELQRLAEERIRREMDEFREDYEKKPAQRRAAPGTSLERAGKVQPEVVERFPPLQHDLKMIEALVDQVWKLQETYGNYVLTMANSWLDGMQKVCASATRSCARWKKPGSASAATPNSSPPGHSAAPRHHHRRSAGGKKANDACD
jgi:hypothetical protein